MSWLFNVLRMLWKSFFIHWPYTKVDFHKTIKKSYFWKWTSESVCVKRKWTSFMEVKLFFSHIQKSTSGTQWKKFQLPKVDIRCPCKTEVDSRYKSEVFFESYGSGLPIKLIFHNYGSEHPDMKFNGCRLPVSKFFSCISGKLFLFFRMW